MTITEAVKAGLGTLEVSDNLITKTELDLGVTGSDTYEADDSKNVDLIIIGIYKYVLASPEYAEGSFRYKINTGSIKSALNSLQRKHGLRVSGSGGGISGNPVN